MAELIIDALHDARALRALEALASLGRAADDVLKANDLPAQFPRDWFEARGDGLRMKQQWQPHAAELAERSRRAWQALHAAPLQPAVPSLRGALRSAALLFDAALYFEVHELLEPYWLRADAGHREALQGLIQIAVAFQHLANGNIAGARALLDDGSAKIAGRTLEALDLDPFARAMRECLATLEAGGGSTFNWARVPRFPSSS